jgi:murein L,D-transpeptidase YcbB/YkuD
MYSTAAVRKTGDLYFFQDIYGEDAGLEKELAAQPRATVPLPVARNKSLRANRLR